MRRGSSFRPTLRSRPHEVTRGDVRAAANSEQVLIGSLLERLSGRRLQPKLDAIEALGVLFAGKVAPHSLIKALRCPNELVRVEVADALASIGDRRAVRPFGVQFVIVLPWSGAMLPPRSV
jgi:HEAT repeat protein